MINCLCSVENNFSWKLNEREIIAFTHIVHCYLSSGIYAKPINKSVFIHFVELFKDQVRE